MAALGTHPSPNSCMSMCAHSKHLSRIHTYVGTMCIYLHMHTHAHTLIKHTALCTGMCIEVLHPYCTLFHSCKYIHGTACGHMPTKRYSTCTHKYIPIQLHSPCTYICACWKHSVTSSCLILHAVPCDLPSWFYLVLHQSHPRPLGFWI